MKRSLPPLADPVASCLQRADAGAFDQSTDALTRVGQALSDLSSGLGGSLVQVLQVVDAMRSIDVPTP